MSVAFISDGWAVTLGNPVTGSVGGGAWNGTVIAENAEPRLTSLVTAAFALRSRA